MMSHLSGKRCVMQVSLAQRAQRCVLLGPSTSRQLGAAHLYVMTKWIQMISDTIHKYFHASIVQRTKKPHDVRDLKSRWHSVYT